MIKNLDLNDWVHGMTGRLRQLPSAVLESLPQFSSEKENGKSFSCGVYHDITDNGDHVIVAQALRHKWFGMSTAIAIDGFVLCKNGELRPLTPEEQLKYT